MDKSLKRRFIVTLILVVLYVLLANSKTPQDNFALEVVAVSMIVPVLGGILFGRLVGFWTGILGTFLTYLTPVGSGYELLAVLPHGIMGFLAGHFQNRIPSPILACTLFVGHLLNTCLFVVFGRMELLYAFGWHRILGVLYATFFGVVAIMLIAGIFRLGFKELVDTDG